MVARNRAGQSDCLPSANSVVDDNDDDNDDDDNDDDDVESRHNSHWLACNNDDDDDDDDDNNDKSGPSRWINYYDAASLYPSSGKHARTHTHMSSSSSR